MSVVLDPAPTLPNREQAGWYEAGAEVIVEAVRRLRETCWTTPDLSLPGSAGPARVTRKRLTWAGEGTSATRGRRTRRRSLRSGHCHPGFRPWGRWLSRGKMLRIFPRPPSLSPSLRSGRLEFWGVPTRTSSGNTPLVELLAGP